MESTGIKQFFNQRFSGVFKIKWGTLAGNELKGHWHDVDQE